MDNQEKWTPEVPMPHERWKTNWNFSKHHLSELERHQVDTAWKAMRDAIHEFEKVDRIIGNKKQAPEELKKFFLQVNYDGRLIHILHYLTEMLDDPYELEQKQLARKAELESEKER